MTRKGTGLRTQVVSGFFWSATEKTCSLLVQLGVGILLLRLLEPSDYGVLGMLAIFMAVANAVIDSGFSQALIQKQVVTNRDYSSVFYTNILLAIALYLLLLLLSHPISQFYETPLLSKIAPWLFCILPINALSMIQTTVLTKKMDFKSLSKANFTATLLSSFVAIWMAYRGFGVWALVVQMIAVNFIRMALLWLQSTWRPTVEFSMESIKGLFRLGSQLFATGLISSLFNNLSYFIIGKAYNSTQLGYYTQSMKLKDSIAGTVTMSVQNVTFPAFSSLQDDNQKLRQAFHKVITLLTFLLFPAMIGLIAIADDAFYIVAEEKWMPAVPYFKIFCLSALLMSISSVSVNIMKAKGAGGLILKLELVKKSFALIVLLYATTISVEAIAWSYLSWMAFEMVVNLIFVRRLISYKFSSQLRDILPYFALSAVMYFSVIGVEHLLQNSIPIYAMLCIKVVVGVATYALLAWIIKPKAWGEAVGIVRSLRDGAKKHKAQ